MDYYSSNSYNNSSRGRFSSRGGTSYRGGGGRGDSYRGSRGYSRGSSYTNTRGSRGGGGSYYQKYDSSPKYSSDSKYGSYQRFDDSPYRKSDGGSYMSSRDHREHRSDMDMPRKRPRNDYSPGQGSGGRRGHDGDDIRGGGGRYVASSSYSESRSYSDSRPVFKKPRITEYKPKDEYRSPREIRPSFGMTRTRSLRGRPMRSRGIGRPDSFLSRKRVFVGARATTAELLALRKAKILKARYRAERLLEDDLKDDHNDDDDKKATDKDKTEEGDKEKKTDGETGDDSKAKEAKEKVKRTGPRTDFFGNPFIKLQCPQCTMKCVTFKEYSQHLYTPLHVKAMRDKNMLLKKTLAQMRMAQRVKQKAADEEDLTSLNTRTIFCPLCKLNYSQDKAAHQMSEAHKKMKNFLLPYCKVCRIAFKSPMLYENHVCALDHLRRKHQMEERAERKQSAGQGLLDNFMVLDSVGSGDETEEGKAEEPAAEENLAETNPSDEHLNLGVEYIHKREVYFCDLCRIYLPRLSDPAKIMRIHCRTKTHLKNYLHCSDDEMDQLNEEEQQQPKVEAAEGKKAADESLDDDAIDEKAWADVGDILNQAETEAKSDDEDEEEGGRFDRFKTNEKKENGEVAQEKEATEGVVKEAASNAEPTESVKVEA